MGLFSRNKGDTSMSRKKRDATEQAQGDQQEGTDQAQEDSSDAAETDVLEPQRDGESADEFKARQVQFAQAQLTAAEQATSALYARKDGESDADYQSRIDEIGVRGQQPAPVDATYQMPESPTLADQRAYLLHYNLVSQEDIDDPQLDADAIAKLIATHAADLASRREQAAMRGDTTDLPVNPSLAQLRTFVTTRGLISAEQAEGLDVAALQALVIAPPPPPPTIDLRAVQPETPELPFGGDPPRYFVVLEGKALYLEGVSVTLRETQIVNDRSHDIEQLKRLGVRLIETVNPVTAGSV